VSISYNGYFSHADPPFIFGDGPWWPFLSIGSIPFSSAALLLVHFFLELICGKLHFPNGIINHSKIIIPNVHWY